MKVTQSYSLDEKHIATIKAVAKDHGDGSASAALRYIIDQYVKLTREAAQRPAPQAPQEQYESEWMDCEEVVTRDRRKREAQKQAPPAEAGEGEQDV